MSARWEDRDPVRRPSWHAEQSIRQSRRMVDRAFDVFRWLAFTLAVVAVFGGGGWALLRKLTLLSAVAVVGCCGPSAAELAIVDREVASITSMALEDGTRDAAQRARIAADGRALRDHIASWR